MSASLIIKLIEALATALGQIAPLVAQGQTILSLQDATAVHAALTQAEASTAALRPQVDAALEAAARN